MPIQIQKRAITYALLDIKRQGNYGYFQSTHSLCIIDWPDGPYVNSRNNCRAILFRPQLANFS